MKNHQLEEALSMAKRLTLLTALYALILSRRGKWSRPLTVLINSIASASMTGSRLSSNVPCANSLSFEKHKHP
jgi:hypothetical protein